MNLILDIGNSYTKLALFEDHSLLEIFNNNNDCMAQSIIDVFEKYPKIEQVLISSVSVASEDIVKFIPKRCKVLTLDHTFLLPFINLYQTPDSLGFDRIALVSGAINKYPNTNILIIDAGTCITYDFVDDKSQYHGGAISPGLRMRYKALNSQTSRLPHVEPDIPNFFVGNTTNECIHSGITLGIIHEIEGAISKYSSDFPNLTVVLTGGDRDFLFKQLKISIFAVSNLLLEGLNHILELNSNT